MCALLALCVTVSDSAYRRSTDGLWAVRVPRLTGTLNSYSRLCSNSWVRPHSLPTIAPDARITAYDEGRRPTAADFLRGSFFNDVLLRTVVFASSLVDKNEAEKGAFLKGLPQVRHCLEMTPYDAIYRTLDRTPSVADSDRTLGPAAVPRPCGHQPHHSGAARGAHSEYAARTAAPPA